MEYSHRPFEEIDVCEPRGFGDVALCWALRRGWGAVLETAAALHPVG